MTICLAKLALKGRFYQHRVQPYVQAQNKSKP